ncbi:MAG TPA: calcium-binding protein [Microvirga sp.]|nr:calcium-binding protein [Microvirga sp.]
MAVQDQSFWGTTSVVTASGVDLDAITMLPNGGYVVAFRQNSKVGFQVYNGNGDKVGGTHFVAAPGKNQSNQTLGQWEPSLTTKSDGTFVVGWTEALATTGGGRILRHQQFDANGNTVVVNNTPVIKDVSGTVLFDGAGITDDGVGGWITAYIQDGQGLYIHDVFSNSKAQINEGATPISASGRTDIARIRDYTNSNGDKVSDYVISYKAGNNLNFIVFKEGNVAGKVSITDVDEARVVALLDANGKPNGKFAVNYWGLYAPPKNVIKVYDTTTTGQIQDPPISTIELPNPSTDSERYKSDIVALRGGGYVVAYKVGASPDIHVKIFDAQGGSLESPLIIPLPGQQVTPALSELHDGRIALSWHNRYSSTIETVIVDARATAVTLTGTGANDIYAPSKHAGDIFDGGAGVDTLTFKESRAGISVKLEITPDQGNGAGFIGDAAGDTYSNFENVIGSRFNDTIVGSRGANRLEGGAGDDTLTDVAGNGADTLIGGAGNDTYNVSATNTVIDESGGGYDQVNSSVTYTLSAGIENLFATGGSAIDLTGNGSSNIIVGNGVANRITGHGGDDALTGHGGNDVLDGGDGNDGLNGGDNEDVLVGGTGNDALDGGFGNDNLAGGSGFDNLQGGAGNDTLDGGADNDVLDGGVGADTISGSDGNDRLMGGGDNDNLNGGAGDDTIDGGAGADVMDGGAGNDSYVIDDAGDVVNDTGGGIDSVTVTVSYDLNRLIGIENITGVGTAAFTFTGTADNNVMNGSEGINILDGAAGNDTLRGNGGNDTLKGGDGIDWLDGGAGRDTIYGQDGNDVLSGGADKDFFVFDKRPNKRTNVDKILDYNVRDDSIYLENSIFKVGSGSLSKPKQMASKYFYKGSKAHDRDDRIIYDQKKGVLYYDKDGTGSSAAVKIATFDMNKKPALILKDFFVI